MKYIVKRSLRQFARQCFAMFAHDFGYRCSESVDEFIKLFLKRICLLVENNVTIGEIWGSTLGTTEEI